MPPSLEKVANANKQRPTTAAREAGEKSRHSYLKLKDQQIRMMKTAFSLFDQDGSGSIETVELQSVLASMKMNRTQEEVLYMSSTAHKSCVCSMRVLCRSKK